MMHSFSLPGPIDVINQLIVGHYQWRRFSFEFSGRKLHINIEDDRNPTAKTLVHERFFIDQIAKTFIDLFVTSLTEEKTKDIALLEGDWPRFGSAQSGNISGATFSLPITQAVADLIAGLSAHERMTLQATWSGMVKARAAQRAGSEKRTPA